MKDLEQDLDLSERAAIDFVAAVRKRWSSTLYPALLAQLDPEAAPAATLDEAAEQLSSRPIYPWFSHLERQQQKMLWRVMSDAVLRRTDLVEELLDVPADGVGRLELDDDIALPAWYTDIDIHIQPGAVWSANASAFIYELGARVVMLRDNDGYKFHKLFATTALPDLPGASRVVDMGCGFGKSTRPLVDRYPGAEIVGVDLSGPNVKLAHAHAEDERLPIRYRQAPSYATGLEDGSADLVTGTMVLHEMPAEQIQQTLEEAARLLKPGGEIRFLEFWPTGDPIYDTTVIEHAERNNEPFFHDLFGTPFPEAIEKVGLVGGEWIPFDETAKGLSPEGRPHRTAWGFPWAVLVARKPEEQNA